MKNVVITETEAFLIEGRISAYEICKPVQLKDGTFAIPIEVLKNEKMKDLKHVVLARFKEVNVKGKVVISGVEYKVKRLDIKKRI